jgi:hypothetical protein
MGKAIVAAALSGMLVPNSYRETPYGPTNDYSATGANAAQAGKNVVANRNAAAQKQLDDSQTRKLMTIQNNTNLMKNMAASTLQQHAAFQTMVDASAPLLKSIKDYDATRATDQPQALIAENLSKEDAEQKMQGHYTEWTAIPTGTVTVLNPQTHENEEHPTYSIVNPQIKVPLNEETTQMLALVNPQYKDVWKLTNGNVKVPLSAAVSAQHLLNEVHVTQNFADSLAKEFGTQAGDVAAAVRQNRQLIPALDATRDALAAGAPIYRALDAARNAPNGAALLTALGVTRDEANAYIEKKSNEELAGKAVATASGKIASQDAKLNSDQAQASLLKTDLENKKLEQDISQTNAGASGLTVPKGFTPNPNASQLESADLQKDLKSKGVPIPANFESLYAVGHNAADLKTLPPNPRKGSGQMSAQEGLAFIRQYINPQYQEGDYAAASALSKELASTRQGTAGGSLLSAGVASNHLELLDQAAKALNNQDVQLLNRVANNLGVQVGDSPAVTFGAIADQVNQEVGKVVAGGTPHEAELDNLRKNLNSDQSPEQVKNVIRSYIGLMSGRVNEVNERSQQYFGRDVKGISPSVARVFARYGYEVPGYVTVTVNGQTGSIPKAQVPAFKKKYPTATTGGQ